MKKRISKLELLSIEHLAHGKYFAMKLKLPADICDCDIHPGQFVNVQAPNKSEVMLRRPISVCDVENQQLTLLVRIAGKGTEALSKLATGDLVDVVLPLGNGFDIEEMQQQTDVLLVGGGVGIAPLLYLCKTLSAKGVNVHVVLGFRSKEEIILVDEFEKCAKVEVCTDDGSYGTHGLVTSAQLFSEPHNYIACCGPTPMMKAVAKIAKNKGIDCAVSLENMMACGVGACLCCVEKNKDGHNVCVCTQGPVFNINELPW